VASVDSAAGEKRRLGTVTREQNGLEWRASVEGFCGGLLGGLLWRASVGDFLEGFCGGPLGGLLRETAWRAVGDQRGAKSRYGISGQHRRRLRCRLLAANCCVAVHYCKTSTCMCSHPAKTPRMIGVVRSVIISPRPSGRVAIETLVESTTVLDICRSRRQLSAPVGYDSSRRHRPHRTKKSRRSNSRMSVWETGGWATVTRHSQ